MKVLPIGPDFADKIRNGEKTLSVRTGQFQLDSDKAILDFGDGDAQPIVITAVTQKKLSRITDDEAVRDGHADAEELRAFVRSFGRTVEDDDVVSILDFEVHDGPIVNLVGMPRSTC